MTTRFIELNLVRMVLGRDRLRATEFRITKADPHTYLVETDAVTIEVPATNVTHAVIAPEVPKEVPTEPKVPAEKQEVPKQEVPKVPDPRVPTDEEVPDPDLPKTEPQRPKAKGGRHG